MLKKWELKKNRRYQIGAINGENYDDCSLKFGIYEIIDVDDEQCFKIKTENLELKDIWWDSQGFKIKESTLKKF